MSKELFDKVSIRSSRLATHVYSTSFSIGIRCLARELRDPIYSIYGFVRYADEIVDTFHGYDKSRLLDEFKSETYRAIDDKISLHPILNSFQMTVHNFGIERELYEHFFKSMEMDLTHKTYDQSEIESYILGSAEVVGLMCLRVFCCGDETLYQSLKRPAMKLGSAFQKVNFLRDVNFDYHEMGRCYFPGIDLSRFDETAKRQIEEDIEKDFREGYQGIRNLPKTARFGVYVAYLYYTALFKKIKSTPGHAVLKSRVRIDNPRKLSILAYSFVKYQFNLI